MNDKNHSFDSMRTIAPSNIEKKLGHIDKYELLEKLGSGAFGVVYKARDTYSGIYVALKTLHPILKNDAEELARVKENFRCVATLSHPHIAAVKDLSPISSVSIADDEALREMKLAPKDPLLVMAYAPGVTLSQWKHQFKDDIVPISKVAVIARQIADALDYAHTHDRGIVHRDIKPANIMVETNAVNHKLSVQLLDFGLAAEIRSSMSRISTVADGTKGGTRPYMAPEQWAGLDIGGQSDQYSLACVIYELLSGEVPFAGVFETGDVGIMRDRVENCPPDPLPNVSDAVNAALMRALSKNRKERFPSCVEFVDAMGITESTPSRVNLPSSRASLPRTSSVPTSTARLSRSSVSSSKATSTAKVVPTVSTTAPRQPARSNPVQQAIVARPRPSFRRLDIADGEVIELSKIPAGSFVMGSPATEQGRNLDEVLHEVKITKTFWMARTPITQKQWSLVMGTSILDQARTKLLDDSIHEFGPGKRKSLRELFGYDRDKNPVSICGDPDDRVPMYWIDWNEAKRFCKEISKKERAAGRIAAGYEYRLPTEAEWEYACRAGSKTALFNGRDIKILDRNNASCLDDIAWYAGNSWQARQGRGFQVGSWAGMPSGTPFGARAFTRPVKGKRENAFGLYDMLGNVFEWCEDWYAPYSESGTVNPVGPARGRKRVCRGGSWDNAARCCRSAYRRSESASFCCYNLGFRIVLAPILR